MLKVLICHKKAKANIVVLCTQQCIRSFKFNPLPVLRPNRALLPRQIRAVVLVHLDPVFSLAVLVAVGQKVTLLAPLEGDL